MTVAAASPGASVPAQAYPLDPQIAAMVAKLPAEQQAAARQQLSALTPAQQQQVLAQAAQQAQAAQAGAGAASATPAAGMAGAADAATGAAVSSAKPPNKVLEILKFVGIGAAAGGALGFGASFLTLPIIGKVAAPMAAAVGAGVGAIAGLVLGIRSSAAKQKAFDEEQAAAAQAQVTTTPQVPDPAAGDAPTPTKTKATSKAAKTAAASGSSYTVVRGDSLFQIAQRHDTTWQEIYELNRAAVGSNPNLIHPGLKLKMPA